MPKTRNYAKRCEGKKGYSTPERAREEISRSHRNANVKEYFCPWCRKWHVGHARKALKEGE